MNAPTRRKPVARRVQWRDAFCVIQPRRIPSDVTRPDTETMGETIGPRTSRRALYDVVMHSQLVARASRIMVAVTVASAVIVPAYGCAVGPIPVSDSLRDPSNPKAPEGATPPVAATVTASVAGQSGSAPTGPDAAQHTHGGADVVYACPMHPEVTSTSPSSCPKCNMKLVPRK